MANNFYIKPGENRAYISSSGTTSANASRIEFRALDETTIKAAIYELNSNIFISAPNGTLYLGDGTPANVELGAPGTPVDLDFLGGGTISSNGNSLDIGIAGDTFNLNVTGVNYIFPSLLARDNEVVKLSGNQTITGTKTFSSLISGSISGNAGTATQIATTQKSDNVEYQIPFVTSINAGNQSLYTDSVSSITFNPSTNSLSLSGDLVVNGGDITTSSGTFSIGNTATTAQTLNLGAAATASGVAKIVNLGTGGASGSTTNINIGSGSGGTTTINSPTLQLPGTINWNPGANFKLNQTANSQEWSFDITRGGFTGGYFQVWDSALMTLFRVDAETGNGTFLGDLAVNGGDITTSSATFNIGNTATTAQTLNLGTAATANGVAKTINLGTGAVAGSTTNINIGSGSGGTTTISSPEFVVSGNLTVNGTTTTMNTTEISVDDKNIELGAVASPTDITANGGGITLKGATNKTITWDSTNTNWTSSEHWNIASGKQYKINNNLALDSTTLRLYGSSTGYSNLVSGNTSANNYTVTLQAVTDTLVGRTTTDTLTNKTLTAPRITSGSYIADSNGNELINFPSVVTSAVNELYVSNAATGNAVTVSTTGGDPNIGLNITTKGTGAIVIDTGTGAGHIDLKPGTDSLRLYDDNSSNYYRFLTGDRTANYDITLSANSGTMVLSDGSVTSGMVPTWNGTTGGLLSDGYSVSDSTTNAALETSANLVTERDVYYGLVTVNNASQSRANSIYGPTAGGAAGYTLIGAGATSAPTWTDKVFIDATNTRLGIGQTSPTSVLHIKQTTPEVKLEAGSTTDSGTIRYNSTNKSIEFIFA